MQDHRDKWLCPPRDEQSYMRADTTGHSGTKEQKRPLCFFFLLNTPLLRLTSERFEAIRCRWPECASLLIACPGTNRCHPVTTLATTTYTTHADSHTHPTQDQPTGKRVGTCPTAQGLRQCSWRKLFPQRHEVCVLQPARVQKNLLNEEHKTFIICEAFLFKF